MEHTRQLSEPTRESNPTSREQPPRVSTVTNLVYKKILEQDYNRQMAIYDWRLHTQAHVFRILHARTQNSTQAYRDVEIEVQREDCLLHHLESLYLLEGLYFLKSALFTLDKLVQRFGHFSITDKMIGIVGKQCKVWVHEQFQQNHAMMPSSSEASMVKDLIAALKPHVKKDCDVNFFLRASKECNSFLTTHQFLWKYAFEKNILIPPFISLPNQSQQLQNHSSPTKNIKTNILSAIHNFSSHNQKSQEHEPHPKISKLKRYSFNKREEKIHLTNDSYFDAGEEKECRSDCKEEIRKKVQFTKSVFFPMQCQNQTQIINLSKSENFSVNSEFSFSIHPEQFPSKSPNKIPVTVKIPKEDQAKLSKINKMRDIIQEKMKLKKIQPNSVLMVLPTVKSIGGVDEEDKKAMNKEKQIPDALFDYGRFVQISQGNIDLSFSEEFHE